MSRIVKPGRVASAAAQLKAATKRTFHGQKRPSWATATGGRNAHEDGNGSAFGGGFPGAALGACVPAWRKIKRIQDPVPTALLAPAAERWQRIVVTVPRHVRNAIADKREAKPGDSITPRNIADFPAATSPNRQACRHLDHRDNGTARDSLCAGSAATATAPGSRARGAATAGSNDSGTTPNPQPQLRTTNCLRTVQLMKVQRRSPSRTTKAARRNDPLQHRRRSTTGPRSRSRARPAKAENPSRGLRASPGLLRPASSAADMAPVSGAWRSRKRDDQSAADGQPDYLYAARISSATRTPTRGFAARPGPLRRRHHHPRSSPRRRSDPAASPSSTRARRSTPRGSTIRWCASALANIEQQDPTRRLGSPQNAVGKSQTRPGSARRGLFALREHSGTMIQTVGLNSQNTNAQRTPPEHAHAGRGARSTGAGTPNAGSAIVRSRLRAIAHGTTPAFGTALSRNNARSFGARPGRRCSGGAARQRNIGSVNPNTSTIRHYTQSGFGRIQHRARRLASAAR